MAFARFSASRPRLETLEARDVPSVSLLDSPRPRFAVATTGGPVATVHVYDAATNALIGIVNPFGDHSTTGVRVAVGDVTGDGVQDIVVASASGEPTVEVFDGRTLTRADSFLAYDAGFAGGVHVALGDVDGDGRADIVTGAGANGGPHVKLFSGRDIFPTGEVSAAVEPFARLSYFAVEDDFRGGVCVTVADVNGDGVQDIVAGAGPGGGPRVVVVDGQSGHRLFDFFADDPTLRTGVTVAAGSIDASGLARIVTAPLNAVGELRVFAGEHLTASFTPFDASSTTGNVALRDLTGDGTAEILVTSGPGTPPRTVALDGTTGELLRDFPGYMPGFTGGLFVA